MKKDFVLPEKWCVAVGDAEKYDVFNKWRKTTAYGSYGGSCGYLKFDGEFCLYVEDECVEITFKQFKKHVLGLKKEKVKMYTIEELETNEDLFVHCETKEQWEQLKHLCVNGRSTSKFFGSGYYNFKYGIYNPSLGRTQIEFNQVVFNDMETKEKVVVGWKLKDSCEKYLDAAYKIAIKDGNGWCGSTEFLFLDDSKAKARLKQAGVLDLWFEPVHEQKEQLKVGDWVTYLYTWPNEHDGLKTYKIKKIDGGYIYVDWEACPVANDIKNNFRKATPEEIKAAQTPNIVVNGHKGEFFDDYVKFGCAEINREVFIDLSIIPQYAHTNREIELVTIGKGTFTKQQINEIAEFYLKQLK